MLFFTILILCQIFFILYALRCVKEAKIHEKADANADCFYVSIGRPVKFIYCVVFSQILLFCTIIILFLLQRQMMLYFILFTIMQILTIALIKQNLMVKGDQIIKTYFWGIKKAFTLKSIKKMDLIFLPRVGTRLLFIDNDDKEICSVGLHDNNVDLLIERLKSAGISGINEIERNAGVSSINNIIASEPIKPVESQHYENVKFDVKCDTPTTFLYYFALILITPIVLFLIHLHISPLSISPLLVPVFAAIYFVSFPFKVYIRKMTYNNNVFECINFLGFIWEFKTEDISYVNLLPNKVDLSTIRVFLRNGKCVGRIGKDYENFELLIVTLKHEGVEFK